MRGKQQTDPVPVRAFPDGAGHSDADSRSVHPVNE